MWMEKMLNEEPRNLYFTPQQEHHGHVTSRDANWILNFSRQQLDRCLTGMMTITRT
jgi:hypothetical protein